MTEYEPGGAQRPKVVKLRPVPDGESAAPPQEPPKPPQPPAGDSAPPWENPEPRRPVLPGWALERNGRLAAIRWAAGHVGHHAAFHGVRLPHYSLKIVLRAPLGAGLALVHGSRWVFDRHDAGSHHLLVDAAARRDHKSYAAASRIRKDRVRTRMMGVLVAGIATTIALLVADLAWPPSKWAVLGLAVAGAAGTDGRATSRSCSPR